MKFEDQIYWSIAVWTSLHPNRLSVLNHLFCVYGNGYEWVNGQLVERDYMSPGRSLKYNLQFALSKRQKEIDAKHLYKIEENKFLWAELVKKIWRR